MSRLNKKHCRAVVEYLMEAGVHVKDKLVKKEDSEELLEDLLNKVKATFEGEYDFITGQIGYDNEHSKFDIHLESRVGNTFRTETIDIEFFDSAELTELISVNQKINQQAKAPLSSKNKDSQATDNEAKKIDNLDNLKGFIEQEGRKVPIFKGTKV